MGRRRGAAWAREDVPGEVAGGRGGPAWPGAAERAEGSAPGRNRRREQSHLSSLHLFAAGCRDLASGLSSPN